VSERQEGILLSHIEKSHRARYYFASNYIKDGDTVLDACCGVGYGSYIMASTNLPNRVDAFDGDAVAIEKARTYYSHDLVNYAVADTSKVFLIPTYYNLITCFEAIEHLVDPVDLLYKLNDSLDSDGVMLLSTPNALTIPYSPDTFPEHITHFFVNEMEDLLRETGFKVRNIYSQPKKRSFVINNNPEGDIVIYECVK
jgi:2-polyprenyl-3-methyl-5-hydroxy-6-metoxy-1,4-benzoquinol methylase